MNTPCPHTGGGVHRWLLSEANRCRSRGLHPETVQRVLRESTAGCGRSVPAPEIAAAVRRAFDSSGLPAASRSAKPCRPASPEPPKWPVPDEARMRSAAGDGYATATDLADWLVRALKMPFRDAHHVTGRIVALASKQGVALHELPLKAMQQVEPRITADALKVLSVDSSVKSRTSFGGTAPKNVVAQAKAWAKRLEKQRK